MDSWKWIGLWLVPALMIAGSASGQGHGPGHGHDKHPARIASPYAGMERRTVKALSEDEVADLRAGRGMGLALAAELNGYPGPLHALELADALNLTGPQRDRIKALFAAMKADAIAIGERIIVEETVLDRLFVERKIDVASLEAATARIGAAQASLRAAHLRAHLAMMDILSPEQAAQYGTLRGYVEGRRD